jgi:hypothetical protein
MEQFAITKNNMKIGILTYHRAENYGALLQAYALSTFMKNQGHAVTFIDYWPEYHVEHYRVFSLQRFKKLSSVGKVVYILTIPIWATPRLLRKSRLERFMHKNLCIKKRIAYSKDDDMTQEYDVAIYGSDQIWRRQDIHNNEFNNWYFGSDNVIARKKITYAASMGIIDTTPSEDVMIQKLLKTYNALSVREKDLQDYLTKLGYNSSLVIDPVFLLNKEEWGQLFKSHQGGDYILFYNLLRTEESIRFAEALSHSTGLPIKEINMEYRVSNAFSNRYYACASLERFLQMIEGATYIVSSSFHGVAFSLIFEKQFWAVGMRERSSRAVTLLNSAGIPERYIQTDFLPTMLNASIDYSVVQKHLEGFISSSKDFLNKSLAL